MKFLSIEHELPSQQVTNAQVRQGVRAASAAHLSAGELDTLDRMIEGLFDAVGTTVRYHRAPGETAYELALRAGARAIEHSGLDRLDIDLLIYVGIGRGILEPASGTIFQDGLGLRRATTFDVLDACASWLRGLHLAQLFLQSGTYRNIMILNAEFEGIEAHRLELKSLAEFEHWHPSVTIGEAATATIVTADDQPDDFQIDFRTSGELRHLCYIPLPNVGNYFAKEIARYGVRPLQFVSFGMPLMRSGAAKLIQHYRDFPEYKYFDADLVFGHGASDGMSRYIAREVGMDLGKVQLCHRLFANTVSASIPLALSHATKNGLLENGHKVLLMMASAGLTTGLAKFTYYTR
jgi:3-oxoacyl-[acyl-carrier-protein] synthase III